MSMDPNLHAQCCHRCKKNRLTLIRYMLDSGSEADMHLTAQNIHDAVNVNSPALIKEIYEIANKQMQSESARQTILDGKASSLLSTVGLGLTLTFTLGCQIMLNDSFTALLKTLGHLRLYFLIGSLVLGSLCAIIASCCALLAVKVTAGYRGINEGDIFKKKCY